MSELRPFLPINKKGKMLVLSNRERKLNPFDKAFPSLAREIIKKA
jgi:hypothetical protein